METDKINAQDEEDSYKAPSADEVLAKDDSASPPSTGEGSVSVRVAVRVRPISSSERNQGCRSCLSLDEKGAIVDAGADRKFGYDFVYGPSSAQSEVYKQTTVPLLDRVFEGFNATILAYGQTGSGKTFTMGTAFGGNGAGDESVGIIPRAVHEIFERRSGMKRRVDIRVSFLEIHHEEIRDLLAPQSSEKASSLAVRETTAGNLVVAGLSSHAAEEATDVEKLLSRGTLCRATAATHMNAQSSRSHAICTLTVEIGYEPSSSGEDGGEEESAVEHVGKLTLVDLAGSERAKRTGASGRRLQEGIAINRGLLALGNVISVLADLAQAPGGGGNHVPYRDSKLTRILQDSLGGSSHTLMLACVSPADSNLEETTNTLRYAARARAIKNAALRNETAAAAAAANTVALAENAALRRELRLLRLQFGGSNGGGESSSGQATEEAEALRAQLTDLGAKLAKSEAALQAELEASLEASLRADRLRLKQEQLLAVAKAQGVELHPGVASGGGFGLAAGLAGEDTVVGGEAGAESSGSLVEEQRRELEHMRRDLNDFKRRETIGFSRLAAPQVSGDDLPVGGAGSEGEDLPAHSDCEHAAANQRVAAIEEEAEAMLQQERCMEALRVQYAGHIERLEAEVAHLQQEADSAQHTAAAAEQQQQRAGGGTGIKAGVDVKELTKVAKEKAKELEAKTKELARKQQEHARTVFLKERAEAEAIRLKAEVTAAKRARADLQKMAREESKRHAKHLAEERKAAVRAQRDAAKTGAALAKAEAARQRSEQMLRQKHEEVGAAMRRVKEMQRRVTASSASSNVPSSGLRGKKSSARAAQVRQLVQQEYDLAVAVGSCRRLLKQTGDERAGLQQKLDQVNAALAALVDEAGVADSAGMDEDAQRAERAALNALDQDSRAVSLRAEASELEAEIVAKSNDMAELQEGVLGTFAGASSSAAKEVWADSLRTLGEARQALVHLLDLAVTKRVDAGAARQVAEQELRRQLEREREEALAAFAEEHAGELSTLRREMTEKIVLALQAGQGAPLETIGEEVEDEVKQESPGIAGGEEATSSPTGAAVKETALLRQWLSESREQLQSSEAEIQVLRAAVETSRAAAAVEAQLRAEAEARAAEAQEAAETAVAEAATAAAAAEAAEAAAAAKVRTAVMSPPAPLSGQPAQANRKFPVTPYRKKEGTVPKTPATPRAYEDVDDKDSDSEFEGDEADDNSTLVDEEEEEEEELEEDEADVDDDEEYLPEEIERKIIKEQKEREKREERERRRSMAAARRRSAGEDSLGLDTSRDTSQDSWGRDASTELSGTDFMGSTVDLTKRLSMESDSDFEEGRPIQPAVRRISAVSAFTKGKEAAKKKRDSELHKRLNLPPPPPLIKPLEDMKVPELKDALRARGLGVSGKKEVLIERLQAFLGDTLDNAPRIPLAVEGSGASNATAPGKETVRVVPPVAKTQPASPGDTANPSHLGPSPPYSTKTATTTSVLKKVLHKENGAVSETSTQKAPLRKPFGSMNINNSTSGTVPKVNKDGTKSEAMLAREAMWK